MKTIQKTILVLLAVTAFLSCSKSEEDDSVKEIPITYDNLIGTWYYKETFVTATGAKTPHVNNCSTKRDNWDITINPQFARLNLYDTNCVVYTWAGYRSIDFWADEKKITGGEFVYYVKKITATELYLEYDNYQNVRTTQVLTKY